MIYRSKKDWWMVLLILPVICVMFVFGILFLSLAVVQVVPPLFLAPGLVLLGISMMILWAFFEAFCEITPSDLMVRFGPLRWRIPLEAIVNAVPKKGMAPELVWGLAWSLDRVIITYRKRSGRRAWLGLAVSPEGKEEFLNDLAQAVANVQFSNSPANPPDPER